MGEHDELKPEKEHPSTETLTNTELDAVAGGFASADGVAIISPRDSASGLPTGKTGH